MNKTSKPISETHPDLAKEAHGWDPDVVSAGSGKKLEWKCTLGHIWVVSVSSRKSFNSGCPICSNKQVLTGFNDLATIHPDLAKESHGWNPSQLIGGHEKLEWKCTLGHIWVVSVSSRKFFNSGCPICSNMQVLTGFNDLATTHPDLANQAYGWDPKTVIAGSSKKLEWKCLDGHIWMAIVDNRANKTSGCPICSNQKILAGFNDLATTHPDLANQAYGWDPSEIIGGHKKLEWKCSKGHYWKASASNRKTSDSGCPICSNQKILAGFNDLATTHPDLANQAYGWDPKTVIAGSSKKLEWDCPEGHHWSASGNDRTSGYGCPSCAASGFDPNSPAYLYFLVQNEWEIYQIGITNVPDTRLRKHKRNGFELLELRGPMDGRLTQEIEQSILKFLKSKNVNLPSDNLQGKFDGYTESWTVKSFNVTSLKSLIDMASDEGF